MKREGFNIKIEKDKHTGDGEPMYLMLVTTNGFQYSGGAHLSLDELLDVAESIIAFIKAEVNK